MAVRADVFDVQGRLVARVADREFEAGSHSVVWDGKNVAGNDVTQGVYFCRFRAGDAVDVRKVVALR
jgi:glucuronoarabinoxylan endo-1,4-beta-xylanase